jgi:EAL and modified HD-GYP domain-containing signal transduction protein
MTNVRIARQPILNDDQIVQGYELLYPTGEVSETLAAARVTIEALSEIGFERLVGTSRAWINVTPEFSSSDMVLNLPPDRVVLELGAEMGQDAASLARLEDLRSAGYTLAADHFSLASTPPPQPLLGLVDFVKIDMRELGARELARHAFELRALDVTLVACNVETGDEFKLAQAAGAGLFQGFFFCRPHMLAGRRITPSRVAMLSLSSALQDPDIQISDLERVISNDVALSYRLLKYINSAYFSLRKEVTSIKQALALLGIEPLRRWATLSIFAEVGEQPRELLVTALIRARFCETAGLSSDGTPAELFTLGLFSVLDALTATPMYTAIADLPLAPTLHDALIHHSGPGRLLDSVIAIEEGEFDRANAIVPNGSECYVDAVAWCNELGAGMLV